MAERRHNLAWSLRPLARSSVGREGCRGHTWGTPEPIGKIGLPPASGRRTVHTVPGPGRSLAGRTPRWLGGRTAPLDLRRPLRYGNCTHSAEGVLDGEETIPHSVPNTQFLIPTNSVQCPGVSAHEPRWYVQNRRKRVERGLQWLGLTILPLIASFSYSSSADPLASAGQTAAAAVLPY